MSRNVSSGKYSRNCGIKTQDSFVCGWFQIGRPLYLDHFRRDGSSEESRYVAGERSGLTTLVLTKHGE